MRLGDWAEVGQERGEGARRAVQLGRVPLTMASCTQQIIHSEGISYKRVNYLKMQRQIKEWEERSSAVFFAGTLFSGAEPPGVHPAPALAHAPLINQLFSQYTSK